MSQAEYDGWVRAKRRNALPAIRGGLFSGACGALALAAWKGYHVDWRDVLWHAGLIAAITAAGVFIRGFDDDDEPAELKERTREDRWIRLAAYLVFAGTGAWALTGDGVPNIAIFALTLSGLFALGDLVGRVRARRRERDQLGL
jgi:hypothetical protein